MPISGLSAPICARREREPVAGEGQVPEPADAERGAEHGRERLDVRDQSEQAARHDDGIRAGIERRLREIGHPLALAGELDPQRNPDGRPHRRDDRLDARGIELGRHHAARLARIGRADIELEDAHAGLLDRARHLDRRIELRQDQARHCISVDGLRFPVERDGLLQPRLERLRREAGAARHRHSRRRLRPPGHRPPCVIQHHVLGALQLIPRGLRFVGRLDHHRADAGGERAAHAVGIDQVLGRGRDQRVLELTSPTFVVSRSAISNLDPNLQSCCCMPKARGR